MEPVQKEVNKWCHWLNPKELIDSLNVGLENKRTLGGSNCWAKVTVQANRNDDDRLIFDGNKLLREALALLVLFVYTAPVDDYRRKAFSLAPFALDTNSVEFIEYSRYVVEDCIDGRYEAFPANSMSRAISTSQITDDLIDTLSKEGLDACSRTIRDIDQSELHKRIRRALEYFDLGMRTRNIL